MDVRFGVHAGLQNTTIAELRELWRRIEELGFDWISIWDHFYAADATGNPHCLEAITTHTALAASTERVQCGSLVYSAGYRHPAVLANAIATLDQVADGRTVLGLGGGWLQQEYDVYGIRYGSPGERLRMLNEYIQCVRGLLTQERTTFAGEFFTLRDAACEPKPVQERLPIWIGGGGEKVTLRICAEYADGWNVPFIPPEEWSRKAKILDAHCERLGRDPSTVTKSVNVGMAFTDEELKAQFGAMANYVKPGVLSGSVQEMVDKVGGYVEAGASWVILAMRAPFDRDGLERFAAEVMPAVAREVTDVDTLPLVRDEIPANQSYAGIVAEAYDTWMPHTASFHDDAYFRAAIEHGDGPALELACGTGRLLVRYAVAGLDVEGADVSPDMLAICAGNARTEGVEITLHEVDVARLELGRRYATIYNPASSFTLHTDANVARGALRGWREHLEPGGRLLVSMFVPRQGLDANYEWAVRRSATRPSDGTTFVAHAASSFDVDAQIQTTLNRHEVYDADGVLQHTLLRRAQLRWWERAQLEAAFAENGFVDVHSDGIDEAFVTVGTAPG